MIGFETALLCEGVRQEASGKYILIGVNTGTINVKRFPLSVSYNFVVICSAARPVSQKIRMRILGPSDDAIADIEMELEVLAPDGSILVPTPSIQVVMSSPGRLTLQVAVDEEEYRTLKSWQFSRHTE
jgi:hypothetical protein